MTLYDVHTTTKSPNDAFLRTQPRRYATHDCFYPTKPPMHLSPTCAFNYVSVLRKCNVLEVRNAFCGQSVIFLANVIAGI